MSNNLRQAKKDLKAFAKRAKDVKYTESLLFSYLITGMITFSIGLNTSSNVLYERMNKELVMSADKTRTAIKKKKKANEEAVEELNLELVQLMEQGDQVVKSPFSSWQFGINYFHSNWGGTYKGSGNKTTTVIYQRDPNNKFGNYTGADYGRTSLKRVIEPISAIPVDAAVKPKNIEKQCPATLKTAIVQSTLWLAPREEATMSGKTPFNTSQTIVKMASFLANLGSFCFKTLKTFVAPMLLLPSFFISTCPKIFARMRPDGMLPSK